MRAITLDRDAHTWCEWCGHASYTGETVLVVGKRPYCNRRCADKAHDYAKQKQRDSRRERAAA